MREKVVIVGGGVAGLTAAHELIERGFEVHLFERRDTLGGKASGHINDEEQPREHGFRFFPGWYRHLTDTLARIPFDDQNRLHQSSSVFDNLVSIDANLMTWYGRPAIPLLMHIPRNLGELQTVAVFLASFRQLGLSPGELSSFLAALLPFAAQRSAQTTESLRNITWWDYLDAGSKSQAFQDLVDATTRTMVAAKAREASAETIGKLAVRTLFDALSNVDRVLNGPTNEVWIDPWVKYLTGRGVKFHTDEELDAIQVEKSNRRIAFITTRWVAADQLTRLRHLLDLIGCDRVDLQKKPQLPEERARFHHVKSRCETNLRSARDLVKHLTALCTRAKPGCVDAARATLADELLKTLNGIKDLCTRVEHDLESAPADPTVRPFADADRADFAKLDRDLRSASGKGPLQAQTMIGDHFVFALPVEHMAYFVNRSPSLTYHAPELANIIPLVDSTSWMLGVQFYLKEPFELAHGHIICIDSEWGLTAIEQTQFWKHDHGLSKDIKAVISVDVAVWDRKGRFVQKEGFNCTNEEVAKEVWMELKAFTSPQGHQRQLRDDMLLMNDPALKGRVPAPARSLRADKPGLKEGTNFRVDASLADVFDRRKQGTYERARGVTLGTIQGGPSSDAGERPFVWGPHLRVNVEPLLINRVGSHALRPAAQTRIGNMYLAADYVQTDTDLACMEGANEAARRAVNALLLETRSREPPCALWDFSVTSEVLAQLTRGAKAAALGAGAGRTFTAAARVAGGVFGAAGQAFMTAMNSRSSRKP